MKRPLKIDEEEPKDRVVTLLDEEREQLIKDVLPSIITTVEDKHSDLSQQLLFHLSDIFHTDFGYFLNRLLAGFVGDKIETKTATI